MHDDHIGPQELLPACDLLLDGRAMVRDELEVEIRDPYAGVALTRRRLTDVAPAAAKPEVAVLDRVEKHRPIDLLGRHVHEGGVTLQLRQPEIGPERCNDRAHEVSKDVLGVVQLDLGEVAGVPGDVGDQEAGRLRGWGHRSSEEDRERQHHIDCSPASPFINLQFRGSTRWSNGRRPAPSVARTRRSARLSSQTDSSRGPRA